MKVSSAAPSGSPDDAAGDERRYCAPVQRMPQLPDAVGLDQKTVTDDESRGLRRGEDVQPDAGDHQAHGKSGQPRNDAAKEHRKQEKRQRQAIHRSPRKIDVTSAWMRPLDGWLPSQGEAAISPAMGLYTPFTSQPENPLD